MRNYYSFFVARIIVYLDNNLTAFQSCVGGDEEEINSRILFYENDFINFQPYGPGVYTFDLQGPLTVYWLIDKTSLSVFLGGIEAAVWDIIFPSSAGLFIPPELPAPGDQFMRTELLTPRYRGWKDQYGEKHAAPPSDRAGARRRK